MAKISNRTPTGKIGKCKEDQYFNVISYGTNGKSHPCKEIVNLKFEVGNIIIEITRGEALDLMQSIAFAEGIAV